MDATLFNRLNLTVDFFMERRTDILVQRYDEVPSSFGGTRPMVNLGEVFVEWMGEDAFGLDQRGVTRNPDKMQMGAYDAVLSN